jgi:hypothetical protein
LHRYIWILFFIASGVCKNAVIDEKELSQVLGMYKAIAKMEVPFHQVKKLKEINLPLSSDGILKVQQPDVIWEIKKPSHLVVFLTPQQIRIESGDGTEKSTQVIHRGDLGQGKESQSLQSLVSWLQMDAHQLSQEYAISRLANQEYLFEPRAKAVSPFEKLQMTLSSKKYVQHLTLFEKSGDSIEISFGEPKIEPKKLNSKN